MRKRFAYNQVMIYFGQSWGISFMKKIVVYYRKIFLT
jgi:hypothetical protein